MNDYVIIRNVFNMTRDVLDRRVLDLIDIQRARVHTGSMNGFRKGFLNLRPSFGREREGYRVSRPSKRYISILKIGRFLRPQINIRNTHIRVYFNFNFNILSMILNSFSRCYILRLPSKNDTLGLFNVSSDHVRYLNS